ncbi:TonB family protein [Hymenobacter endophyticus]|uniref:TonB family protein n=1 Tax=Hymenobacter endophyticus TaxID=3076335 RepID=A0ABU3TJ50_9BACT|nr:TonB family protein [Hymenobacter endophyticus]MDU0371401.1 TonB family protein [Hymenobacter endophyticus]
MMRPLFSALWVIVLILLLGQPAGAQLLTRTYYTATGRTTANPDSAAYYTVVQRQGAGGSITTYKPGGQRLHQEQYSQLRSGQRQGFSTEWNPTTGRRVARYPYQRGKLHGVAQAWYPGGQRRWQLTYQQGQRQGSLRAWYPNGRALRTETYRAGLRTAGRCFTRAGRDTAWFAFERPAQFVGGDQALHTWLTRNLRYPAIDSRNQVEGNVRVRFVVDKRGRVQNPEIVKGISSSTDAEVLRLLSIMPAWQPAVVAGRAVAVPYELPVEFRIL